MRLAWVLASLGFAFVVFAQQTQPPAPTSVPTPGPEAPTGFDNQSNGYIGDDEHKVNLAEFDAVEGIADGLGPLYNAQSCRECHQNPVSGAASQITELRVGHPGPDGRFQNPQIPIAHGTEIISGRSLVNDRAICPNGTFPDTEIQERVPETETIRTLRVSLNVLGDGFVEAVPDQTLIALAKQQCARTQGKICGYVLTVPIVEAPGKTRVGRFGWKNQHGSLLSFAADAYLNEMGITSRLQPDEVTKLCNTTPEPNSPPTTDGSADDIEKFARFMRSTKAPPRDQALAATPKAGRGSNLFDSIGCATCHVRTLTTAPSGTKINGGMFTIPNALGGKTFHPFSDFLLHDVGSGDGILQVATTTTGTLQPSHEHYGRKAGGIRWRNFPAQGLDSTQFKLRTPPLWGVRKRTRLMHDGASVTFRDAIRRHRGEASDVTTHFERLPDSDQDALLEFLKSL